MKKFSMLLVILLFSYNNSLSQIILDFPAEEFQQRRHNAMDKLPNGLIVFQAKTEPKTYEQHAFLQDQNFYYFTGLSSAISAILLMDSPNKETWLFTPLDLTTRSYFKPYALIPISKKTEEELKIDHVVDWNKLTNYIDKRINEDPTLKIYADFDSEIESGPPELKRIENTWLHALKTRWSNTTIEYAEEAISLRQIKSEHEIAALRSVGENSVNAFLMGLSAITPGKKVKEIQGEVVKACTCNDGNGIYFWPFIGSGKYSIYEYLRPSFLDYRLFDHKMKSGELVRIDVGCDYNHYKGDVGRTIPVSGIYYPGQQEVYNLLIEGYFAGLETIKDGIPKDKVRDAFDNVIKEHANRMKTEFGKKAIELLLSDKGLKHLIIHNQGLGGYEGSFDTLRAGMVVAWEPKFAVEDQGFYLEDLILVKPNGYEILTPGLPYTAEEIEEAMKK